MSKSNSRKNRIQKTILLDEESAAIIAHIQSSQNLSFNAAVKVLIKRHKIKYYGAGEKVSLIKLLHMLGQLKFDLKDIPTFGSAQIVHLLEQIRDLLIQIRNAIFSRMGRKP